jgi:hypothetical protein
MLLNEGKDDVRGAARELDEALPRFGTVEGQDLLRILLEAGIDLTAVEPGSGAPWLSRVEHGD